MIREDFNIIMWFLLFLLFFQERIAHANISNLYDFSQYKTFDEYVMAYRKEILKIQPNILNDQLNTLAPLTFIKKNNKCKQTKGILLIHGLFVSPFMMSDIMKDIINNNNCIMVRSLILPGHAIKPNLLLDIKHQDFINATDFVVKTFNDDNIADVTIIGHSLGGALALNQILKGTKSVKKIAIFTPAIDLGLKWYKIFGLYIISGLGKIINNFQYIESHEESMNLVKHDYFIPYTSFSSNAILEVHKLINLNKDLLSQDTKYNIKVFLASIDNDPVVNNQFTIDIFNSDKFTDVCGIIYSNNAIRKFKDVNIMRSQNLNEKIIDISHIGITLSDTNIKVGKNAPINYGCLHLLNEKTKNEFRQCTFREGDIYYGEITPKNCSKYNNLSRITYNPYFKDLMSKLNKFLS